MNSYFTKERIMPRISSVLSEKSNRDKLIEFTEKFINEHSEELLTTGPVYRFCLSGDDATFLYDLCGVTKQEIMDINRDINNTLSKEHSDCHYHTIPTGLPHGVLIISMIIESLDKGYTELMDSLEYLIIFMEYSQVFGKFWFRIRDAYQPVIQKDIMDYTIENLSNRYIIKKQGNLLHFLKHISHAALEYNEFNLERGNDFDYENYIRHMSVRLTCAIKIIASKYFENYNKMTIERSKKNIGVDLYER